ncbi:hypothetical protein FOPG_17277 [Fusarium oxysporum f. sp. conglutinans race 2 54008]|uniref:Uncharacterized protein n=1 Tax=Fusarium oxysporum f. sp. conglutinans race 2 54008 TaxID=1089457 RepID=X0H3G6_FUSOX|nr:hypothetical protein FOPG_17277 [Fusarium oxysporum f. sp. conglutinans race 2 54008]KAI8401540.1 hypothetical protein FOFC_18409 [Fusarium oxysporum]
MKKLSDGNFMYPAGTSSASKQSGASDLLEAYAAQRDNSPWRSSAIWTPNPARPLKPYRRIAGKSYST